MGMPAEHTALIQRSGFPVPTSVALDDQERGLLARYGYWLEALASGAIAPMTPEQQQFVRVARGDAEPQSAFERVWVKCRRVAARPHNPAAVLAQFVAARAAASTAKDDYSKRRLAILEQVRAQLDALDAEFADRLASAEDESARLETETRAAVLAHGASLRYGGVYAMYARGRVTWDSKGLAQYTESHPEVGQFRRVGSPTVSLRYPPSQVTG